MAYFEDSIRRRYVTGEEIDRMPFYRPRLDVVETKTYNIDGPWAHTRPDDRVIVMLPPEFRDYNLPIFAHEVLHNCHPGWSEGAVHRAAFNKAVADHAVSCFDYNRRRA